MVLPLTRERKKASMIDIHCHILPGIDDGAKNVSEAVEMITMQRTCKVNAMYLTPHFSAEEKTLEEFLLERDKAWEQLAAVLDHKDSPDIRIGAEVRYCQEILSMDLRKVTLGQSDYLLLELPSQRYPAYALQSIEKLLEKGIIPILAHVERCSYFREDPNLLKRLIDLGALAQVSAQALFDKRDKNFSIACLCQNLAQIVASDAHDPAKRKPNMDVVRKLPRVLLQSHNAFSEAVWKNELPPYIQTSNVRKTFFGYR